MLKCVSIQNFKSLKDVTLDLQKVNLLIGPNNSGKTNFLKALEFMSHRLHRWFDDTNTEYSFKHSSKDFISIKFVKDYFNSFDKEKGLENLSLIFNSLPNGRSLEHWYSKDFDDPIQTNPAPVYPIFDSNFLKNIYEDKNTSRSKSFFQHTDGYRDIFIYKPDPNKLDKPGPVGRGDDSVAADASNLIAFFDRIRDEYPASFAQIRADLAKCVPEFTEINFQNVEATEALIKEFGDKTFKRIGLTDGRQKTIYWADELSEGTLYFLALLCIINQPNPPKLLLLEEPEKGIHPRRIWEVMKFIFQLAEEKDIQIIMTTHNEHVVNAFSSMPESVFVFDKDDETGATTVRNLQKHIIEPSDRKSEEMGLDKVDLTSNLGEYWIYGLIGGVPTDVQ